MGAPMSSNASLWIAGRLGEHRHGDAGAGEPDLVAGQGGQVPEQRAEAGSGRPAGSCWYEALAWARAERRAGATGLPGAGGFWSVKVSGAQAWRRCQVR